MSPANVFDSFLLRIEESHDVTHIVWASLVAMPLGVFPSRVNSINRFNAPQDSSRLTIGRRRKQNLRHALIARGPKSREPGRLGDRPAVDAGLPESDRRHHGVTVAISAIHFSALPAFESRIATTSQRRGNGEFKSCSASRAHSQVTVVRGLRRNVAMCCDAHQGGAADDDTKFPSAVGMRRRVT